MPMQFTHPVYLMATFEGLTKLAKSEESICTFCLEPHTLHLVEVLHGRHSFLEHGETAQLA